MHTSSEEAPKPDLDFAATYRDAAFLFKERINVAPNVPCSSPKNVVLAQGLVLQAPQIEHDSTFVSVAEASIGIVTRGSDREFDASLFDNGKG